VRAHFWTVFPRLRHHLSPRRPDVATEPWRAVVDDPNRGPVAIGGRLRRPTDSRGAVVIVHGLGGSSDSPYTRAVAIACEAVGLATLRLDLRGSDPEGTDIYHAGLVDDAVAALSSPELAGFDDLHLLGFSLGGHVALRTAIVAPPARLRSVAAVCAPLDLAAAQRGFDRPVCWLYRVYVLRRLKQIYAGVASRAPVPTPVERVLRVTRLREWDELTVVPRFGFADAADYYRRASVGPLLPGLGVPALLVASPGDPMVSRESIAAAAAGAGDRLELRWVPGGGHVGFPPGVDVGAPGPPGLETQLAAWLAAHSPARDQSCGNSGWVSSATASPAAEGASMASCQARR
jgi:predicted alpha/beta-fold hydrolase